MPSETAMNDVIIKVSGETAQVRVILRSDADDDSLVIETTVPLSAPQADALTSVIQRTINKRLGENT